MDLKFLKSNRFVALILLAIVIGLNKYGVIPTELYDPLLAALLGFIGIRSLDRASEKIGGTE